MIQLHFTRAALGDLSGINRYTAENWGVQQAALYARRLADCCTLLISNPLLGRACDDLGTGVRRIEQGSHVIFYSVETKSLLVLRILHKRMIATDERLFPGS